MTKFALLLEYDGSSYHGWQTQSDVDTVQDRLELALSSFANHDVATITAGRTDTGVHALNQVVHFHTEAKRNLSGWISGVNSRLPSSIRVKKIVEVNEDFDARFSAISRTYHYYLMINPVNSALFSGQLAWYYKELNIELMQQAAQILVGRHDFSSFRAASCQANSPIRELSTLEIQQQGKIIRFSLTANAFLHHMVRNIVGALVYVGGGRMSVAQFQDVFAAQNRKLAPPTFMPNGLYLVNVEYPVNLFEQQLDNNWLFNF